MARAPRAAHTRAHSQVCGVCRGALRSVSAHTPLVQGRAQRAGAALGLAGRSRRRPAGPQRPLSTFRVPQGWERRRPRVSLSISLSIYLLRQMRPPPESPRRTLLVQGHSQKAGAALGVAGRSRRRPAGPQRPLSTFRVPQGWERRLLRQMRPPPESPRRTLLVQGRAQVAIVCGDDAALLPQAGASPAFSSAVVLTCSS